MKGTWKLTIQVFINPYQNQDLGLIVFLEKNDRIGHAMQQQVIRRAELWSELVRKQVLGQDLQEEHAGPGPVGNTEWQQC